MSFPWGPIPASSREGQSTIEFLIVSVFSVGILALFIQLAINLTGGYLVHYATYMASRTFMVHDEANVDRRVDYIKSTNVGKNIFDSYEVKLFGVYDPNGKLEFNFWDTALQKDYLFTGAYYLYRQPMSVFNYFGGGVNSPMRSESFLGKEPTRGECWARTKEAMEALNVPPDLKKYTTVFDNGC